MLLSALLTVCIFGLQRRSMVNVDYALSPNSIDGNLPAKLLANYSSEVQLNNDEVLLDTSLMSVNSRHPTNRIS